MTRNRNTRRLLLLAGAGLVCLVAGLLVWQWQRAPRYNVLLITLDTTRADHLGCYGYQPALTPHFDQLAREGTLFEHAYCTVPLTLPAHASLLTGLYPPEHGLHINGSNTLAPDIPTIATELKEQGFATGGFISAHVLNSRYGLHRGFDNYDEQVVEPAGTGGERKYRNARSVTDAALHWLEKARGEPFFCWVHYYDPHRAYSDHSADFGDRFRDRQYDGEIAFVDKHAARLFDFLRDRHLDEQTLIVVIGDHGEAFGEHGEQEHGNLLYQPTLRVPLLVRLPGVCRPQQRISTPVSQVDFLPTVRELNRLTGGRTPGRSLLGALRGEALPERDVYFESEGPWRFLNWAPQYGLISQGMKFVQTARPELFDQAADPAESRNLFLQNPEQAAVMRERLAHLSNSFVRRAGKLVELSSADLRELNAGGYATRPAHGGSSAADFTLPDPKEMLPLFYRVEAAERLSDSNPEQGKRELQEVVALKPDYEFAVATLGAVQLKLGQEKEAVRLFQRAIDLNPTSYVSHINLGNLRAQRREWKQAQAHYEAALQARPESVLGHINLGNLFLTQGDIDQALSHLEAAVELAPTSSPAKISLAQIYARRGEWSEAKRLLGEVLERDPRAGRALLQLGEIQFRQGEAEAARASLRKAVELEPENAAAHNGLGIVLLKLNQAPAAQAAFERAVALRPDETEYRENLLKAKRFPSAVP